MTTQPPNPNSLQDVLQDIAAISAAVAGPELYGDERDAVISLLNKLLASCGIGAGYYRAQQPPYSFTPNNIFHRLRGICYNQINKFKNTNGLVSLILKVPPNELESQQQKQKVIDAINSILRSSKQQNHPTLSFLQAPASKPTPILHAEIRSVIPLGDHSTELLIYAKEQAGLRHGPVTASELYSELTQPERESQIRQCLNCEKIVPRLEVNKSELESYLQRPPPGFEEIWVQAIKENPDPENLIPYPIQGFQQLLDRRMMQQSMVESHSNALKSLSHRLVSFENDLFSAHNRYIKYVQDQKQLSNRLLTALATQTMAQRYGMSVDEKEEQLECRLEQISVQLNAPNKIKDKIVNLYETLRRERDSLKRAADIRNKSISVSNFDTKELKRCLATRQSLLEDLVSSVKDCSEVLSIIEHNKDKTS